MYMEAKKPSEAAHMLLRASSREEKVAGMGAELEFAFRSSVAKAIRSLWLRVSTKRMAWRLKRIRRGAMVVSIM